MKGVGAADQPPVKFHRVVQTRWIRMGGYISGLCPGYGGRRPTGNSTSKIARYEGSWWRDPPVVQQNVFCYWHSLNNTKCNFRIILTIVLTARAIGYLAHLNG
ncbi:MAG: hypothetical protein D3910_27605 [Candidatus Electrothrix sp. ATG2]|nr:hypothetical protein [Candidatus Electrothrix sp. ATG2]